MRQYLIDRESQGAHRNLLPVLRSRDEDVFRNYMRMPPALFDTLLELVSPLMTKEQTYFRASISPSERVSLTLRYMAILAEAFLGIPLGDLRFATNLSTLPSSGVRCRPHCRLAI